MLPRKRRCWLTWQVHVPFPHRRADWARAYEFGERSRTSKSKKTMPWNLTIHCTNT